MYFLWCLVFVVTLDLFNSVQSYKMCSFNDTECMTNGAKKILRTIVEDSGDPIDPLHVEEIKGKTENIDFRLSDLTLRGFKKCEVTYLTANKAKSTYEYHLRCPKLILNYMYEVNGKVDTFEIDGKSLANLTVTDYEIITYGIYGVRISEKDKLPHFYTKSFDIGTKSGHILFKSDKLVTKKGEDITERFTTMVNENWKVYKEYLRTPIVMKFMTMLLERIDMVLSTMSPSEAFQQKN